MPAPDFFSPDYATARARFVVAAQARGARVESLALSVHGPAREPLAIDIAWLGAERPRRALVHASGLHGVEGFAGSAIQLALLEDPPVPAADAALVFVHALNPWGMAWRRRANEHNVDLNRNFRAAGKFAGEVSEGYRRLAGFLNPETPPAPDAFHLRAAGFGLRYGFGTLTQAIAEGQYAYPKGIFYGGARPEESTDLYRVWIAQRFGGNERPLARGLAIDLHTGLGRWCTESLFLAGNDTDALALSRTLGAHVRADGGHSVGYAVRGGHANAYAGIGAGGGTFAVLTQELGSYSSLRVLHALREENRWHHYGSGTLEHRAKQELMEVFAPHAPAWREWALARGRALVHSAARALLS